MSRLLATAVALCLCAPAFAHDHVNPNFDSWYQSLQRPDTAGNSQGYFGGGILSCCNKSDCHETEAEIRDNDWWARLVVRDSDGSETKRDWVRVPPEKIIRNKANPTGSPVICHTLAWNGTTLAPTNVTIYCFVPSFET